MKKLIFLLMLVCSFSLYSQTSMEWQPNVNLATMTATDSVLQLTTSMDISGMSWSCDVVLGATVDSSIKVSFGASNYEINSTTHLLDFSSFASDSLPYIIARYAVPIRHKVNGSSTVISKRFQGVDPFGSRNPQIKLWKYKAKTGTVYFYFKATK